MLPGSWVDSIFARLAVRYGQAWMRMWEGIDIAAVKTDWATELGGLDPEAIKHALANLPAERPPTIGQFKALCVNWHQPAPKQLRPPDAKKESIQRAKEYGVQLSTRHPKQWAHDLAAREKNGGLTITQKRMWREALEGE